MSWTGESASARWRHDRRSDLPPVADHRRVLRVRPRARRGGARRGRRRRRDGPYPRRVGRPRRPPGGDGARPRRDRRRSGARRRRRGRCGRRCRRARQLRGPRPDRRAGGADRRRVPRRAGDEPVRRAGRDEGRAAAHARARPRAHRAAELDGRRERQPGPRRVRDLEVRAGGRVGGARGGGGAVRDPGDDRRARPVPHRLRGTLDAAVDPDGRLRGHTRAGGSGPVPRPGRRPAERPGAGARPRSSPRSAAPPRRCGCRWARRPSPASAGSSSVSSPTWRRRWT